MEAPIDPYADMDPELLGGEFGMLAALLYFCCGVLRPFARHASCIAQPRWFLLPALSSFRGSHWSAQDAFGSRGSRLGCYTRLPSLTAAAAPAAAVRLVVSQLMRLVLMRRTATQTATALSLLRGSSSWDVSQR